MSRFFGSLMLLSAVASLSLSANKLIAASEEIRLLELGVAAPLLQMKQIKPADADPRMPLPREEDLVLPWKPAVNGIALAIFGRQIVPHKVIALGNDDSTNINECGFFDRGRKFYGAWNTYLNVYDYPGYQRREGFPKEVPNSYIASSVASPTDASLLLSHPDNKEDFSVGVSRLTVQDQKLDPAGEARTNIQARAGFSPRGDQVGIVNGGSVYIYTYPEMRQLRTISLPPFGRKGMTTVSYSPNGRSMIIVLTDWDDNGEKKTTNFRHRAVLVDTRTWRQRTLNLYGVAGYSSRAASYSPDSRYAVLTGGAKITLIDLIGQRAMTPIVGTPIKSPIVVGEKKMMPQTDFVTAAAFSPDGRYLAWTTVLGSLNVVHWRVPSVPSAFHRATTYLAPPTVGMPSCLAFSRDNADLVVGANNGVLAFSTLAFQKIVTATRPFAPDLNIAVLYRKLSIDHEAVAGVIESLLANGNQPNAGTDTVLALERLIVDYRPPTADLAAARTDIRGLDNADFRRVREPSNQRLIAQLNRVVPSETDGPLLDELRAAAQNPLSLEQKRRVQGLIARVEGFDLGERAPDLTRALRGIEVIEGIGTGYAAEALERIAFRSSSPSIVLAATEAYQRLEPTLPRARSGAGLRGRLELRLTDETR